MCTIRLASSPDFHPALCSGLQVRWKSQQEPENYSHLDYGITFTISDIVRTRALTHIHTLTHTHALTLTHTHALTLTHTGLIKQFLRDVDWGEVDYLVVDTPPGTSDEHLSIVQYLSSTCVDGAVVITTPQVR